MNPIREFFKKKKAFKNSGPGHKLGDTTAGASTSSSQKAMPSKVQPAKSHVQSDACQHAAQAALERLELRQKPDVNWSLAAVRAQARKELELEQQALLEAKQQPKPVFKESCPLLAVSGVYFTCAMIGPHVLPYAEIMIKIKEFLYSQLEEERCLTSCLIIHSCNKDREKVQGGIETLSRYLTNIIDNPTEEKYRKIRVYNKVFQERVAHLEGALDFLLGCGFVNKKMKQGEKEEDFLVFPEDLLCDLDNLQMSKEALHSAEAIRPTLSRNMKLLMPLQSTEKINLPSEFFNITTEELMKEQELRTQAVEINSQLRTKAMREKDDIKELRFYKYSLVRLRFPDGLILQGTFHVREKLKAVKEFIVDNLAVPDRDYTLLAPGGFKLSEDDKSLLELKLIPAVLLNLHWTEEDAQCSEEIAYLKSETLCLLQNI